MTRRIGHREALAYVARREPFRSHTGSLTGVEGPWLYGLGRLPRLFADLWLAEADYVVRSYSTPIAWHVPGVGWIVPPVRYSTTTSRHQGIVRHALAGEEDVLPAILADLERRVAEHDYPPAA